MNVTDPGTTPDPTANVDAGEVQGAPAAAAAADTPPSEGGAGEGKDPLANGGLANAEAKADDGTGDAADPAQADDTPQGAPEAYEEFVLPEGMPEGMVLEPEATNAFKEAAKADNLSQAQAQRYVDLAANLVKKTIDGFGQAHIERIEQWAEQVKADPLVGGPKYDENVQVALSAVSQFGDPELTQAFKEYGLGNHPAIVRAFYRVGKAITENSQPHGLGSESPARPVNREQALAQRIAAEQARGR